MGRGSRVLVVDDDYFARKGLEEYLALNGFEVLLAAGGRQAFSLARDKCFEVAVVDVQMPEWDGFQVAAKLRQLCPEGRIIMFTGEPSMSGDTKALDLGLYDYLPKSTWYTQLVPTINKALEGSPHPKMEARPEDPQDLAAQYAREGRTELASVAWEEWARGREADGDFLEAKVAYEKAAEAYSLARGIGSEGARRLRALAENCEKLAEL